ncbi:MAG: hypothetical protein AAFO84_12610 [Cyanobacteria bacterium J06598_1]
MGLAYPKRSEAQSQTNQINYIYGEGDRVLAQPLLSIHHLR